VPTLKEYNIIVDGKPYKIELSKRNEDGSFSVKINDKPSEVKFAGDAGTETPFSIKMHEKLYEVEMKKIDKKAPFSVKINKLPFKIEFKTPERRIISQMAEQAVIVSALKPSKKMSEEGTVVAPMAGKIVVVKVKEGDSVKLGQVLCILEAMKMENEITAPKTGTIQSINISEGMGVSEGDILLTIK
jgi:biotin carboxyl carrier protein